MEATLTTTAPGESLHARIRKLLLAMARCVWTWQERARERRHLAEMTDHMRADVGLSACDVAHEADKAFWQR
jgi:uncharacterized protein YjiS (DUF1127 family)